MLNITLGQLLKQRREQAGLTQKQLSRELSYETSQFISNWERDKSVPPVGIIPQLCTILSFSMEDFDIFYDAMVNRPARKRKDRLIRAFIEGESLKMERRQA
jgi:transcriptional regulator with XRE-family HTH domain